MTAPDPKSGREGAPSSPAMARLTLSLLLALALADAAAAQGLLRRARDAARAAAERQVENRTAQLAERAVDAAFDVGAGVVRCVFTDPECVTAAEEAGDDVVLVDDAGRAVDDEGEALAEADPADLGTQIASGEPVVLRGILFVPSGAGVLPESAPAVDALVAALQADPSVRIRIGAFADDGAAGALGQLRATSLAAVLHSAGVEETRLLAVGLGTAPTPDPPADRRVEIVRL